ncbi:calcium-binding protein [Planktothrix agardhii 1029]|uniref:Putative secreted protein n=1 Tax=Planktothrix agardhii (strain NIVA-CYA 126/8) TaxID=388467 RepID=A0A073CC47_PLAA1|nr:hypothetical protein [Planktothrix agardhii]KEI65213.1 putative secreted protein [Planktothrix agardhii NIVA-CYA 126/8]MCB8766556.1 calcium-binding protein [Planktothrix agardhii 1809]MCB8780118.1 calcium-binding protein [Planktothrix agardhii 1031]MCB8784593.1 calcium-binding protein [Planktothrix agardhii 1808]MCF3568756.1 calcium-binding protein [Planktothrix agardhii 1807]
MATTSEGFYDLTVQNDSLTLTPGLLAASPYGLRALDGNDIMIGSLDAEIINGNQGDDTIQGGGGNDTLRGGKDRDYLDGQEGDDVIYGELSEDSLVGGVGNDLIRGGKDADILDGQGGNDTLIGDYGADMLTGGGGSDLFVLRTDTVIDDPNNADFILDFNSSEGDRIGLTGGLTEPSLFLRPESISLTEVLNRVPGAVSESDLSLLSEVLGLLSPEFITEQISQMLGVNIDPDGDGNITGTSIEINGTTGLGFVINATPADLVGRFVSVEF